MSGQRPRLSDVAREAGVSLGSASKAINAPAAVREKTRVAVEAAVRKLGYIPDASGRALASRQSRTVGIILPTISNVVYSAFVHALHKVLAGHGYPLFVLAHEYDADLEAAYVRELIGRGVDGLVLIGTDHRAQVHDLLAASATPHIFAWSIDEAPAFNALGISNHRAMEALADYLISLGHRRLSMITGAVIGNERARARVKGLEDAVARHGASLATVLEMPLTIEGGRVGFAEWLARKDGATALVCATDLQAAGALDQARLAGVRVPQDLSVTGFDDIEFAALLSPPLTTIRMPIDQLGHDVGAALVALMQGGAPFASRELHTGLVVRASTAGPVSSPK
ncbi:LacI family DNA-binding transcriptional regulator [Novosphingobium percolationis]|uniref:LacI family DNA-binding transcriptional regulator n=1 Tax=Novosphingobium percolationis TaxID=2871811 RepID=UPI001CD5D9A4|nr:LacI family DNA-binding transcriptional regulator [Novosphingobium percolationis]